MPTWSHRPIFFDVDLSLFTYWPKFDLNIITGSEVMTIFFFNGLTINLENRKYPCLILLVSRQGQVRNTNFCTNVFNKMLLNAAKCLGYSFYCFWVIKGKSTGGIRSTLHNQIRVNRFELNLHIKMCYSRPIFGYSLQKHQQQHENQWTNLQCKTGNWFLCENVVCSQVKCSWL